MEERHLRDTRLLDFEDPRIQALIRDRRWRDLPEHERIGAIYDFVQNEIAFGYNESDDLPASAVLADGYGQCNTKTTLLMALLRATGSGCRSHGATVAKRLQKGIMEGLFYRAAPASLVHNWAEVFYDGRWVGLEGVILDQPYLEGLRANLQVKSGAFCGYGVGTEDLADPPVAWQGTDTQIQATGVNHDLGVFDDPDSFYRLHGANVRGIRRWLVWPRMRTMMNRKVASIRGCR
ncbi:transglutaminase family protein [Streptomyces sp. NPDC001410]|uniref:transglutaminase-like domain-containing protein n=1 Tax=Streptomyces sp. NPDC001410 TaxID=3364574 RepID=UPI0036CB850A